MNLHSYADRLSFEVDDVKNPNSFVTVKLIKHEVNVLGIALIRSECEDIIKQLTRCLAIWPNPERLKDVET